MQLTVEDRAMRIKNYEDETVSAFFIGWTSFYQNLLPYLEYIDLDAFHATRILTSGATQFEKIITRSKKGISVNYSDNDWYADIYYYYINQEFPLPVDRTQYALMKRQAKYYRYDSFTKRLLWQIGHYWAICLIKPKVAPMLQEVHDHTGYFGSKIVLDYLHFRVYWPKMAANICEYIWGCLSCAKWATSAWSVLLIPIQTRKPYELMGIDFIDLFKKSAYGNTYIYNLEDYYSRHMYPYPSSKAGTNNIIILFDHYLQANSKPYAMYMDAGSYFTSQKLRIYF